MTDRQNYESRLRAQLHEWNAQINVLKAKAEKAEASLKVEYLKQIEKLEHERQGLQAKLSELENAGEQAWGDLKSGVDLAWDSLSEAVKSAASRFK